MKEFFITIFLLIFLILGLQVLGLVNYNFFAPKYEEVRRNVFEQTKSYNDGTLRDLENFMIEYRTADESGKQAIKSVILHRAVNFPADRLTPELRNFINELKGN